MVKKVFNPFLREYSFVPSIKKKYMIGVNCSSNTGSEAKALEAKRILVVTDRGVEKAGLLESPVKSLEEEGLEYSVFNRVVPEPTAESWEDIARVVREGKFDLLIGIGGGSTIDTMKAGAVAATNPESPVNYCVGGKKIEKEPLPMIAIPTTSGTGTEVTPYAVVSVDPVIHAKGAIADGKIVPDVALVDPLMTVTLPPKHTAMTGLDALSHAIESVMALTANPLSDALALTSIKLVSENLRTACHHGENINARYNLAWAASLAGWAISYSENTLGHALAQNFAPRYGIPHGISCAVSLPYAMEYNIPTIPDRLALIASAMGEDIRGLTKREAAIKAVKAVENLLIDVEIPISLRELNVPKEDIPKLVDDLINGRTNQIPLLDKNPRKTTKESLLKIYGRMWEGKITAQ